jgi:hypothetical protein
LTILAALCVENVSNPAYLTSYNKAPFFAKKDFYYKPKFSKNKPGGAF